MRLRSILLIVLLTVGLLLASILGQAQDDDLVEITIISTADEHGWIEPFTPFGSDSTQGGAAMIFNWWVAREDYDPEDDAYLLLSGGDNWTGPPISTWTEGEPMVELMNWMGYDVSTIGNHEFDFGRDALNQRLAEAEFPYLSANTRFAASGELADFVEPYTIVEAGGIQVGIIGLTTTSTPVTTHPKNITDLMFSDYAETLDEFVPQMRDEGAELVIVVSHVCVSELAAAAEATSERVDAMFAGHCNEFTAEEVAGIPIMGGGWAWRSYARLTITYDTSTGSVDSYDPDLVLVEYPAVMPNQDIVELVTPWQAAVNDVLGTEIGYLVAEMPRSGWMQANWVTDAWLWAYPSADVAMTNFGGFRQEIPAGAMTVGDVVGVLPFENRIVEIQLTGAQLAENLALRPAAVGGIRYTVLVDGEPIDNFSELGEASGEVTVEIAFLDGREFDPDAVYSVLINDFMYAGGDGYIFAEHDPNGYDTSIQWRQPVIDWMVEQATSQADSVENYIDVEARGPAR